MTDKRAATLVPIHDLIARRWSGRAFDPSKSIHRAQLLALLEAARWAPSCYGDEPWHFIVWDRFRSEFSWQKAFDCLQPGNQLWAVNAPVLVLSLAASEFRERERQNRWAQYDTGAASENLCLQAAAMGLMAHQMGGFDQDRARVSFGIPVQHQPMAMIAIGHPGPEQILDGELRDRELSPRKRLSLDETCSEDRWGAPFNR